MSPRPVPDPILERYRLGELPAAAMADLRARSSTDPDLRARLDALDRSDADILAAYPPASVARAFGPKPVHGAARPRPARRGESPLPSRWRRHTLWIAPAGIALTYGLLLTIRPATAPGNTSVTEGAAYEVRLKGAEAGLAIFRKARGGAELLPPQSLAKPGDTLQVFYHSRGPVFGVIFSVDGSGAVTLHLPEDGGAAAALQAGDLLALPHAYRIDRAPRLERFFLITAPRPFPVEGLLARARAAFAVRREVPDSLEGLEDGFRQYPYTLRKPAKGGSAQ